MKPERLNTILLVVAIVLLAVLLVRTQNAAQPAGGGHYSLAVDSGAVLILDTVTGSVDFLTGSKQGRLVKMPDGNYTTAGLKIRPGTDKEPAP